MEQTDCIIVGGGIGGSVLALSLGQKGKRIIIVEKEIRPIQVGRPEILASSTIDTFRRLGVGERISSEAAIPLKALQVRYSKDKSILLSIDESDFVRTNFQPYSTEPNLTRKLIIEAAEKLPSVQIKRGVEVHGLIRENGRVVGIDAKSGAEKIQLRAKVIVGDDGSYSKLRSVIGINLRLREFPLVFVAAAGPLLSGQPEHMGVVWVDPAQLGRDLFGGIFFPQPGRRTAFVLLMSQKVHQYFSAQPASRFYEAAKKLSPLFEDLKKQYRFPEDFHLFKRPFGHSPRYVSDGIALIGDAAHPVTPAGGQGANASVADAVSLAQHIESALENPGLRTDCFKAYQEERWLANERSVQISVQANRVFRIAQLCPALFTPALLGLLRTVNRTTDFKDGVLKTVSQSFRTRSNSER